MGRQTGNCWIEDHLFKGVTTRISHQISNLASEGNKLGHQAGEHESHEGE